MKKTVRQCVRKCLGHHSDGFVTKTSQEKSHKKIIPGRVTPAKSLRKECAWCVLKTKRIHFHVASSQTEI